MFLNFCRKIGIEDVPESLLVSDPSSQSNYYKLCDAIAKVNIDDNFKPKTIYVVEEQENNNEEEKENTEMKKTNKSLNNVLEELIEETAKEIATEVVSVTEVAATEETVVENKEPAIQIVEVEKEKENMKTVEEKVEGLVNESSEEVQKAFSRIAKISGDLKRSFIDLIDMDPEEAYDAAIGAIDKKIAVCLKYNSDVLKEKADKLKAERSIIENVISKTEEICDSVDEKTKKGIVGKVRAFLGVIFKAVVKVLKAGGKFLFHTAIIVGTFTLRVVSFTGKEAIGAGRAIGKAFQDDIVNEFSSETDAPKEEKESKLRKFTNFVSDKFRLYSEEEADDDAALDIEYLG